MGPRREKSLGQLFAPLGAATIEDITAVGRGHPPAEPVSPLALEICRGLQSLFHNCKIITQVPRESRFSCKTGFVCYNKNTFFPRIDDVSRYCRKGIQRKGFGADLKN